jgi:hypothetical protein
MLFECNLKTREINYKFENENLDYFASRVHQLLMPKVLITIITKLIILILILSEFIKIDIKIQEMMA